MSIEVTSIFNVAKNNGIDSVVTARGLRSGADGMVVLKPRQHSLALHHDFCEAVEARSELGLKILSTGLDPRTPNLEELLTGDLAELRKAMDTIPRVAYFKGNVDSIRELAETFTPR